MTTNRGTSARRRRRWLTPEELETWKALTLLLARLPTALGSQLQCESSLSFVEYYVLAALSDQPERTMRMSQLAVLANSELSRLSHLVTRLEKRGLVRREPDLRDRRFTNAVLTDEGHAVLVDAAPGHVATVRDLVFDVLDEDAQRGLRDAARAIAARLDEREGEGSSRTPRRSRMRQRPHATSPSEDRSTAGHRNPRT